MRVPAPVRRAATWWFGPQGTVEDRMFSWLAVLRLLLLAHAVVLNVYRRDNFVHPLGGAACLAAMAVWTGFAIWAYDDRRRRGPLLLVADLAAAVGAVLLSPVLKGDGLSGHIDANTTNGGVEIDLASVSAGGVRLETVNGGLQLQVPKTAKADISARVVNGGVHIDDSLALESVGEQSRRRVEGHLNGGGTRIELSTTNGGIHITGR